jgi:hypothetical protein
MTYIDILFYVTPYKIKPISAFAPPDVPIEIIVGPNQITWPRLHF